MLGILGVNTHRKIRLLFGKYIKNLERSIKRIVESNIPVSK